MIRKIMVVVCLALLFTAFGGYADRTVANDPPEPKESKGDNGDPAVILMEDLIGDPEGGWFSWDRSEDGEVEKPEATLPTEETSWSQIKDAFAQWIILDAPGEPIDSDSPERQFIITDLAAFIIWLTGDGESNG